MVGFRAWVREGELQDGRVDFLPSLTLPPLSQAVSVTGSTLSACWTIGTGVLSLELPNGRQLFPEVTCSLGFSRLLVPGSSALREI